MIIGKSGDRKIWEYGFDFAIVVAGVFLGLQAQTWAEHRTDRAQENRFVERLNSDFQTIAQDAGRCVAVHKDVSDAVVRVRAALENLRVTGAAAPELAADLLTVSASRVPPGRSAAFVEMLSSGELDLLRSERLREALVRYDERVSENQESWRTIRDFVGPHMSTLYTHVQIEPVEAIGENQVTDLNAAEIAADENFTLFLNLMLAAASNLELLCSYQLSDAEQVLASLEAL